VLLDVMGLNISMIFKGFPANLTKELSIHHFMLNVLFWFSLVAFPNMPGEVLLVGK